MRVMEAASEIGLEHDWLDPGFTLFRPAQNPRCVQSTIRCATQSRFGENLARNGRQQLHCLLEKGFLVLSTCGSTVCTVAKILEMADQIGDICRYRAFWHCLPPYE